MTFKLHAVGSGGKPKAAALTATLGLGSNIGDKSANIDRAVELLAEDGDIRVIAISRKFRSPPWGDLDQDWFVNACAAIETPLEPHELLKRCQKVEADMGRVRLRKWGPRIIDIDVLTFGDRVIADPDLVVPHPLIGERPFVLVPLSEIAPDLIIKGERISKLVAGLGDTGLAPLAN